MTQNSINVTASTGAPIKVNVTASESQGAVTLSQDTSAYNAEIARQWAISDKMVLQEDYSSKYYANKAKDSENSAKNYANVAETVYNNIQDSANGVIADIETARVDAVDNITTVKSESIASVEAKGNEVLSTVNEGIAEINTTKTNAVNVVNNTKTTILQDIEFIANGEKQEIQDLADEIKDNGDTVNTAINAGVERLNSIDALKKSQITNCITEKPKYLDWTYEGGVITLKAGSKLMYPDGFNSDGSRKFSYYTTTKDYIFNYSSPSATSLRWLSISRKQFTLNFGQGMLYVGDTAPTTFASKYMLWYDTTNNILKYTDDSGTTWSTDDGTFPFMTAKTIAGQDGIEYPQNVFDGIGIMDRCIWVADGIKALAPNGRNEDGTLNNKETTSKASIVIPTWVNVSPKGALIGIGGNTGYVTYGGLYYVESETEPTSTYTIWYNPVRNELFYKRSDGALEKIEWAVVGFYNATYGGVYANHLSLTNSNFKEAFRAVDYNDYQAEIEAITDEIEAITDEIEAITDKFIPDYSKGVALSGWSTTNKTFTVPSNGIMRIWLASANAFETFYIDNLPVCSLANQSNYTGNSIALHLISAGSHTFRTSSSADRVNAVYFYPFKED